MNTTDRELLERAAKAAQYQLHAGLIEERRVCSPDEIALALSDPGTTWWNPLEDDGAALRLAVSLRMHILVYADESAAITSAGTASEPGNNTSAVRRAIVRAAAAIGETK